MMNSYLTEENKKRQYAKRFQPESILGVFIITLHILVSWLCLYLLETPIHEWFFDFSQYNQAILDILPKAQYWSNASPVYREKMIVAYGIIKPTSWLMVFMVSVLMLSQYKKYLGPEAEGLVYKTGSFDTLNIKKAVLGYLFMLFICSLSFNIGKGSELLLQHEDIAYRSYSRASDKQVYNTQMGFYVYRLFTSTFGEALMTYIMLGYTYILVFYFKRR